MSRFFYLTAGYTSLALAIAGVPLPVLPSTPFALLACFFFARSSPELQHKLENSKWFGPALQDWKKNRSISLKGRLMASAIMAISIAGLFLGNIYPPGKWISIICISIAALFIWSRPFPKN
jgi:uncharacterized membrane protein YbaN (DUF454 family)